MQFNFTYQLLVYKFLFFNLCNLDTLRYIIVILFLFDALTEKSYMFDTSIILIKISIIWNVQIWKDSPIIVDLQTCFFFNLILYLLNFKISAVRLINTIWPYLEVGNVYLSCRMSQKIFPSKQTRTCLNIFAYYYLFLK